MRSIGSVDVDAFCVSAFFVAGAAGWLRRVAVAACWACRARTGSKLVTPTRTVIRISRRMVADLRDEARYRAVGWGFTAPGGRSRERREPQVEAAIV
jgi:hypothetical protein